MYSRKILHYPIINLNENSNNLMLASHDVNSHISYVDLPISNAFLIQVEV